MLPQYKLKANLGIIAGLVLEITVIVLVSSIVRSLPQSLFLLAVILRLSAFALLVWGCWNYMLGKGYNGAWGFLGLFSFLGLLVLVCFPDRRKQRVTARGFEVIPVGPPASNEP